ncbi:androgen-dependent TFPI-regulating protein isoform 2-T2 [Discoglossus pictus]
MAVPAVFMYHGSVFTWYLFLTYSLFTITPKEQPVGVFIYGGQWKYLTVLNLVLQTLFYAVCFLTDLLKPLSGIKLLKNVISCRDLLFSVLVFPAATHTAVFPLAVLEMLASPHRYPPKKHGLTILGLCSFSYLSWVIWIYFVDGNWVYPFLGLLSRSGFIIFLLLSNILAAFIYIVGETLNHLVWAGEAECQKKRT